MACVIKLNGKWRCQVRRKDFPTMTRTFSTEQEARDWGALEEGRIGVLRTSPHDPLKRPTPYQVPGVYMLFRGSEIRYVGRSVHIYRRLHDHDKAAMDWDGFQVWRCTDWVKAAELERKLIERYKPPLNVAIAKPGRRTRQSIRPGQMLASDMQPDELAGTA